ncbi:MAG TPA: nitroreductase family protein [Nocardioides sp.]|nr:nitroreductase family protein [Nocardioides sp.]
MEFAEVVRRRRMTRAYDTAPVDPAVVERLIAQAHRAPSAGNSAGWAFVVLDTPADVARFWQAQTDAALPGGSPDAWLTGMMRAPVVVVPCSRRSVYLDRYAGADKARAGLGDRDEKQWAMPYWDLDTAMAALLVLQGATDAGLGSCFFGLVPGHVDAVKAALGLTGDDAPHPIGAITIGHPDPARPAARSLRRRTDWRAVAHRGAYGNGWPS